MTKDRLAVTASAPKKPRNPHPNTSGLRPFKSGAEHPRYPRKAKPPIVFNGMSIAETFRSYTESAAHYLGNLLQDQEKDDELRLRAATVILARGWGDVPKQLSMTAINETARAIELTEQQLIAIASSVESGIRQAQQPVIDVDPEQDK